MADPVAVVAAVGAAIGIAQPWAAAAWNRFFRQGRIEAYVTGNVEVGYGTIGPTIAIGGTLRAVHRELFISRIEAEVVRDKDNSRHTFEWVAFRPHTIPLGPMSQQQFSFEIASGFLVSPNAPHRFNVVFSDLPTLREMAPAIRQAYETLTEVKESLHIPGSIDALRADDEVTRELVRRLGEAYKTHPQQVDAYSRLVRGCYWEAGRYSLSISVITTRPDRRFQWDWAFELSDDDAKSLEFNVLNILQAPLDAEIGFSGRSFFFVSPSLVAMGQRAKAT